MKKLKGKKAYMLHVERQISIFFFHTKQVHHKNVSMGIHACDCVLTPGEYACVCLSVWANICVWPVSVNEQENLAGGQH